MTEQNFPAAGEDVEGHRVTRPLQSDDDDVEGHRVTRPLQSDDDDVEGHRMAGGSAVQPGYDEDDVSGHLYRIP